MMPPKMVPCGLVSRGSSVMRMAGSPYVFMSLFSPRAGGRFPLEGRGRGRRTLSPPVLSLGYCLASDEDGGAARALSSEAGRGAGGRRAAPFARRGAYNGGAKGDIQKLVVLAETPPRRAPPHGPTTHGAADTARPKGCQKGANRRIVPVSVQQENQKMKRLFNYALFALALAAAAAGQVSAQPRRPARPRTPAPQAKPTPTPLPTPTPRATIAETPLAPGQRPRFDVNHYRVIAELNPAQHLLTAAADVTFTPLDNTRSVVFELNGS